LSSTSAARCVEMKGSSSPEARASRTIKRAKDRAECHLLLDSSAQGAPSPEFAPRAVLVCRALWEFGGMNLVTHARSYRARVVYRAGIARVLPHLEPRNPSCCREYFLRTLVSSIAQVLGRVERVLLTSTINTLGCCRDPRKKLATGARFPHNTLIHWIHALVTSACFTRSRLDRALCPIQDPN